jgi:glycosyltransferase involved in cell wall biosynthesis
MFKNTPKISVIIPLYNHGKYIEEAVNSVLTQSFADFELIIINDGSADNSEDVVRNIKDDRIRYFYQENQGAHKTINRGIQLAKGEYITILNSDDVYYANRLEEFLKILESDSSINAVFSHIEFINDQGNSIKYKIGAEDNWKGHDPETSLKGEKNIFLALLSGNFLVTTSNLFCRKSVFDNLGLFSNLKYAHDYEFFLKLCYSYKVFIVEKALLKYRIHETNTVKENEAAVSFEVGIVLANVFLTYDIPNIFENKDKIYDNMLKFFNSVSTYNTDRMIMTLLLFGMKYEKEKNIILSLSNNNNENPFRKACIDKFQKTIDLWQESQEAWGKWSETNQRLIEIEQRLSETSEEKKKWWLSSQEAWAKAEEIGHRLLETEHKLSEESEEKKKWWLSSQEAWAKAEEIGRRLLETEYKLSEESEETKKWLHETLGRVEETGRRLLEAEQKLSEATEEVKKWQLNSQEALGEVEKTNQKLIETEQRLSETDEETKKWQLNFQEALGEVEKTNQKLIETEQRLSETDEEKKKWWLNSQEAWAKAEETSQRLLETEQKLSKATEEVKKWWTNSDEAWAKWFETNQRLNEVEHKLEGKIQEITSLRNSRSFRLGRALTWPLRQFFSKR